MIDLRTNILLVDVLKSQAAELRRQADAARDLANRMEDQLWERMVDEDTDSMGIRGHNYIRMPAQTYGSVSDLSEFYEWAVTERNAPELFDDKPHMKLVNELVRQRADNGEPMPPGVNSYEKRSVSKRKSKRGRGAE